MTSYPQDFEDNVRDLLANLYDYLKFMNNPIAQQLEINLAENASVREIRHTILNAIESLKSENNTLFTAKQNRLYNILLLRYIEEQAISEIISQLALSERQYHRDHNRAIQTICQVIWDNLVSINEENRQLARKKISLTEELAYINTYSESKIFYVKEEIFSAIQATSVIAKQQNIAITLNDAMEPVVINVAQPVFRQFIIYVLTELIQHTDPDGHIKIDLHTLNDEVSIAIHDEELSMSPQTFCDNLKSHNTLSEIMKSLNITVSSELSKAKTITICLKINQEINYILIVDDNPDTISLFNRYITDLPYKLLSTQYESDAILIGQKTPLICVILDIMLPEKDGWQILQNYKNHPATKYIPVLICSVLEMEDLALSLGADGFLRKPPTRDEFLSILNQWAV